MTKPSNRSIAIESLGVFVFAFGILAWHQNLAASILSHDGFFHFEMARQILAEGPWVDVRWLPYTVLGDAGPDHHWLWHLLISPFALVEDRVAGLEWAIVVSAALVPAVLNVFARQLGIPFAPLVSLLAVTTGFLMPGRLLMLRAQNLALVLIFASLLAMLRQRYFLLTVVVFAFMQSYHGAVITGVLVLLYGAIHGAKARELELKAVAAVIAGGILGLVASPWFPENVEYLMFHTFFKVGKTFELGVGNEWQSLDLGQLALDSWPAHLLLLSAAVVFGVSRIRRRTFAMSEDTLLFLFSTALFLYMYSQAWRFAEYYIPFACFTAGLLWRDTDFEFATRRWLEPTMAAALTVLTLWQGALQLSHLRDVKLGDPERLAEIARYLEEHAEEGAIVFNSDWVDFVYMVWQTRQVRLVNGLDIHYLAYQDAQRYAAWELLRRSSGQGGEDEPDPARAIARIFGTSWVLVSPQHPGLARRLADSPNAQSVVQTHWGQLFRLAPAPLQLSVELGGFPPPP